jgi:hypothetical protein
MGTTEDRVEAAEAAEKDAPKDGPQAVGITTGMASTEHRAVPA